MKIVFESTVPTMLDLKLSNLTMMSKANTTGDVKKENKKHIITNVFLIEI